MSNKIFFIRVFLGLIVIGAGVFLVELFLKRPPAPQKIGPQPIQVPSLEDLVPPERVHEGFFLGPGVKKE